MDNVNLRTLKSIEEDWEISLYYEKEKRLKVKTPSFHFTFCFFDNVKFVHYILRSLILQQESLYTSGVEFKILKGPIKYLLSFEIAIFELVAELRSSEKDLCNLAAFLLEVDDLAQLLTYQDAEIRQLVNFYFSSKKIS